MLLNLVQATKIEFIYIQVAIIQQHRAKMDSFCYPNKNTLQIYISNSLIQEAPSQK